MYTLIIDAYYCRRLCVTVCNVCRCWLKESRSQWIVSGPILVTLLVSNEYSVLLYYTL